MDIGKLKRNDNLTEALLLEGKDNTLAKKDFFIIYPERFHTVGLAAIKREISLFGQFFLSDGKEFTVVTYPARLSIPPAPMGIIKINDIAFRKIDFKKDAIVFSSFEAIPIKDDIYLMLSEYIVKSNNIPFYLGYEDLIKLFVKGAKTYNIALGSTVVDACLFISLIARDEGNNFLRENYTKEEIRRMKEITFTGLTDFSKGLKDVPALISGGAYLTTGVNTALTIDNPETTDIGKVLSR